MTINSYKLDNGTLKLGSGPLDISCQVTSASAEAAEQVQTTDDKNVLCGETLPGEDTITFLWTLNFNVIQDLDAAGVIAWSYANKGTVQPFEFVPADSEARVVTGNIYPVPIKIGGEVKTRPDADNTWRGVRGEDFDLGDVAP